MEEKDQQQINEGERITRKEALIKVGKYAAFTATAMMLILDPMKSYGPPKKSPPKPRHRQVP